MTNNEKIINVSNSGFNTLRLLFTTSAIIFFISGMAQDTIQDSGIVLLNTSKGKLTISGYVDAYYGYNFAEPEDGDVPYFVSSARHNEATINLAYIDFSFVRESMRMKLKPGFGTYMNANYSQEPASLQYLLEAYVGFKPFAKQNIWIDFGIIPSPYTNEGPISKNGLMYTRSLGAENVPYYLAGAKFSFHLSKKLSAYLYLLNGWQQIQDQNSGKSLGTQLSYQINSKNLLNWNTYIGEESSETNPSYGLRYFTDLFWEYNSGKSFSASSCAYIGLQESTQANESVANIWWQANIIAQYKLTEKLSLAGRLEYFRDPHGVMLVPVTNYPEFSTYSAGLCLNYALAKNLLLRLDSRQFFSEGEVFYTPSEESIASNTWLVFSCAAWF